MASRRRHEQIILKLRHAEQLIADGSTTADAAKASWGCPGGGRAGRSASPDRPALPASRRGSRRRVLIPQPGPDWPTIIAALLDAFEIVLLQPPGRITTRLQRRLAARIRERDRVLVSLGPDDSLGMSPDVRLIGTAGVWEGLGWGFGHLRSRQLRVRSEGRRLAGRPRQATVWLPDPDGHVTSTVSHLRPPPMEASA